MGKFGALAVLDQRKILHQLAYHCRLSHDELGSWDILLALGARLEEMTQIGDSERKRIGFIVADYLGSRSRLVATDIVDRIVATRPALGASPR